MPHPESELFPRSRVPGSGVKELRLRKKLTTASSLWNHNNPTKENDSGQTEHGSFGIITQAAVWTETWTFCGKPCAFWWTASWTPRFPPRSGAQHGERSPERVTYRNGYRNRTWDTRVGTMELHIPKLREGSWTSPACWNRVRRSEKALLSVIQQAYVEGVSTRRVDDLIKALGCDGISSSQVSRILRGPGRSGGQFPGVEPLDGGPYPYVWL